VLPHLVALACCVAQAAGPHDWRPIPGYPGAYVRTDVEGNVHRFYPHPPGTTPRLANQWRLAINQGGRGMRVIEDAAGIHTWQSVDWLDKRFKDVNEFRRYVEAHPAQDMRVTSYGVDTARVHQAAVESMRVKEGGASDAEGNGPTTPEEWDRMRRRRPAPEPPIPAPPTPAPTPVPDLTARALSLALIALIAVILGLVLIGASESSPEESIEETSDAEP